MKIVLTYFLPFLVLCIIITHLFLKRMNKSGFMTYAYIGLIIFCVNSFAVGATFFMHTNLSELLAVTISGDSYEATVVSYTTKEHYDSDDGTSYTMYQPTVEFVTDNGVTIKGELDFSTSGLDIGDTYTVNYNEETGNIITLGFTLVLRVIGSFIFFFIFALLSIGIVIYALGYNMTRYWDLISSFGYYFFIPFLMIGFNLLLIYGIFYGNPVPWYVTLILVFFVFALSFAIVGYFKMMLIKDKPTINKVDPQRWIGRKK